MMSDVGGGKSPEDTVLPKNTEVMTKRNTIGSD